MNDNDVERFFKNKRAEALADYEPDPEIVASLIKTKAQVRSVVHFIKNQLIISFKSYLNI